MRRHVTANSFSKHIFAEKTFQHPQKRLALFVSYVVESAVGFGLGRDRLLDRMSGRSRIAFHCCFFGDSDAAGWVPREFPTQPDFPLWIKMCCAFRAHPRGKSFFMPKIITPRHRHEISKPWVRHFMCENLVDILLCFCRGTFRIKQKFRFVV